MGAAEALQLAADNKIAINVAGPNLVLEFAQETSADVIDTIRRNKQGIVDLLNSRAADWSAADWQGFYEERAALAEFDGGQSRNTAEALALETCIIEWLNRNPEPTEPDRCAWCGRPEEPDAAIVPFGTEENRHTWLHSACWKPWHQHRREHAHTRLTAMGLPVVKVSPE